MPALLPYFPCVVYEVGHTGLKIQRVQVRYLPQGLPIGMMEPKGPEGRVGKDKYKDSNKSWNKKEFG